MRHKPDSYTYINGRGLLTAQGLRDARLYALEAKLFYEDLEPVDTLMPMFSTEKGSK